MKTSALRRFHFLAFALVVSLVYSMASYVSRGANQAETQEPPQTGRYIYSAEGNKSDVADHCGSLSFQKCCQYERDNTPGLWIAIYILMLLYIFLAVAIVCDDFFVPSLELISERLDLSEDVAGATFMAAGSSAPELFTSLASVTSESDVGVGTIVGSAVFNILVIIALTAALTTSDLHLDWRPLVRDSAYYGMSIVLFLIFVMDGTVTWWESVILLVLYGFYIITMKYNSKLMAVMDRAFPKLRVEPSNAEDPALPSEDPKEEVGQVKEEQEEGSTGSPVIAANVLPPVKQGFTEDTDVSAVEKSHASSIASPKSRTSRSNFGSFQKMDSEDGKNHFKHHSKRGEQVRSSLIRRASEIGDIEMKTNTEANEFIEEADEFKLKQMAFDTAKKDHNSIFWMFCSGVLMVDLPEKNKEERGLMMSLLLAYEWFVYVLAVPLYFVFSHTIPECSRLNMRKYYVMSFVMSMVWIATLTISMVILVEKMGCILELSLFIMGLFLVAAGTSIPDAMSSIIVARDGYADMAVSNAIGSNIFDINLGLGLPFTVKAIWQAGIGEEASVNLLTEAERARYNAALASGESYIVPHVHFGIILLGILIVTLATFAFFKFRLSRNLGIAFFTLYIAFFIYGMIKEFVCYDGSGVSC